MKFRVASVACFAVLSAMCACAPHVPGIADPVRIDAHCGPRQARVTGIRSVLASTNDRLLADDSPPLRDIRAETRNGDGAIAYWNDQRLRLPAVAHQLGETGDYAHVRAAAIPPPPTNAGYRHIYLLMRDHGRYRWFTMEAFDLQDICIEGHIQS